MTTIKDLKKRIDETGNIVSWWLIILTIALIAVFSFAVGNYYKIPQGEWMEVCKNQTIQKPTDITPLEVAGQCYRTCDDMTTALKEVETDNEVMTFYKKCSNKCREIGLTFNDTPTYETIQNCTKFWVEG